MSDIDYKAALKESEKIVEDKNGEIEVLLKTVETLNSLLEDAIEDAAKWKQQSLKFEFAYKVEAKKGEYRSSFEKLQKDIEKVHKIQRQLNEAV